MRLPKKNEDIIAIRKHNTNIIELYNVKQKLVVRSFYLDIQEQTFEIEKEPSDKMDTEPDSGIPEDHQFCPEDMLGKEFRHEKTAMQAKLQETKYKEQKVKNHGHVRRFEISPNGLLIAAWIGNEIFIKVLNQTCRS